MAANTSFGRKTTRSISDTRIAGLYDLQKTIGKGHFAVVKSASHVFTGEKVFFLAFLNCKYTSQTKVFYSMTHISDDWATEVMRELKKSCFFRLL